jgi:uncharacterized cupredoxin-like copper-binding protein
MRLPPMPSGPYDLAGVDDFILERTEVPRMFRSICVVVAVASLAVAGAAFAASERSGATTVTVTAGKPSELRFTLSKRVVPKGAVTFRVTNKGALTHDFRIAGKKTKLLASGKSGALAVVLSKAGKYPYLCTVPGHAAGGMKGTLTVK